MSEFKVGDKVVRRGSIHYASKSFSLWEVLAVLQTCIPTIEVTPLTKKGKIVHASQGVYAQQQFDHATPEEIKTGRRISPDHSHATKSVSEWSEHRLEEVERVKRIEAIERDH